MQMKIAETSRASFLDLRMDEKIEPDPSDPDGSSSGFITG
jgi:hypothetical protein